MATPPIEDPGTWVESFCALGSDPRIVDDTGADAEMTEGILRQNAFLLMRQPDDAFDRMFEYRTYHELLPLMSLEYTKHSEETFRSAPILQALVPIPHQNDWDCIYRATQCRW